MSQHNIGMDLDMPESKGSEYYGNTQNAWSAERPRLDVVFVIDLQSPIHLDQRKKAWEEVKNVCDRLNANCHQVQYEKLDLGEANELEAMYNADVALVDLSVDVQKNTLFYHLGVRESFGMKETILTHNDNDIEITMPYKLSWTNYPMVRYRSSECGSCLLTMPTTMESGAEETPEETRISLSQKIKRMLKDVETQSKAQLKEKFLADLRKARDTLTDDELSKALHDLMKRLDDPNVISEEVVYNLLASFREIQDYDSMVNLIKTLEILNYKNIIRTPKIVYLSAFALSRRNKDGDRQKALRMVTKALEEKENQVPHFFGLGGRIYKDKFVESNYKDKDSLEQAIQWYRKGFEVQSNEYTGINLATLLVVSGQEFSENEELQHIGMLLNHLIGKKGSLSSLQDYWDVATFFEMSVLARDYGKAVHAAECMFHLKPPKWYLTSTMGNLTLIEQFRKQDSQESQEELLLGFWTEYLEEAIITEAQFKTRIPVLILEPSGVFKPSYVNLNLDADQEELKSLQITNVCFDCLNSRCNQRHDWIFTTADLINLSLYKRDDHSAFFHILQNSEDKQPQLLYFPSSQYRNHIHSLVLKLQQSKRTSSKITNAGILLE